MFALNLALKISLAKILTYKIAACKTHLEKFHLHKFSNHIVTLQWPRLKPSELDGVHYLLAFQIMLH